MLPRPRSILRRDFLTQAARAAASGSLFPLAACGTAIQKLATPLDQTITELENQIPGLMQQALVPAVSIALIKQGRLHWQRGFGVKSAATKEPIDADTVFQAASASKPVFAYAVMKLCERGVMDLDTPLTKYTPERFLEGDPRLDLITARHVLSHTSGLPNFRSGRSPLAIHFTPASRWSYSGEGYGYLQSVVTRLAGGRVNPDDCARFEADFEVCAVEPSIDVFMNVNVLKPFGMSSSGYLWTDAMEAHVARGHNAKGDPSASSRKPTESGIARYGVIGGLNTTPTDYAKFLIEILNPKSADEHRLTANSLREMLRPQVRRNAESSWALGWEINHTPTGDFIRHSGGNPGFQCLAVGSVQRKSGCVIMTNSENGYYGVIVKLLSSDTLTQFLGGSLRQSPE